jgi:hypothetical protein
MKTATRSTGFAMAATAAAMLASAPMVTSAGEMVRCMGVNSCSGHSDCKTATSSCKGLNSCKGQGFLSLTKDACDAEGGTVES